MTMSRREDRVRQERAQEAIQKSREVLGEARAESTQGIVGVPMKADRFLEARQRGQGARPGDSASTPGRDRFAELRTRTGGARPS